MDRRVHEYVDSDTAQMNINKYIEKEVFVKIIDLQSKTYLKDFEHYFMDNNSSLSMTSEGGRTWIMLEREGGMYRAITIGQSQDIKKEIKDILSYMKSKYSSKNKKILFYRNLYNSKKHIIFYEINIDLYIKYFCNLETGDIEKNLFYEISKDYFVEALVAYNTSPSDWNYSFAGMDKRFYYHIIGSYAKEKGQDNAN